VTKVPSEPICVELDELDRVLLNRLQDGVPVSEHPFRAVANEAGCTEAEVVRRLERLLERGLLSRFGPLFNAEAMGGAVTLAALAVPAERYEAVTQIVNSFPEVAHNYAREHALNMWFVVSTEQPGRLPEVLEEIERATGLPVYNMPREHEYYIGLRLPF
jgi:siroheme decarboxylase